MGLMYSNSCHATRLARIRRERKAEAAREGVDITNRRAYREWENERTRKLCASIREQCAERTNAS